MRYMTARGQIRNYPHSFGRTELKELSDFLKDKRTLTFLEVARGDSDPQAVAMRHDVDHSLEHALQFARWEHARGIHSSYYVLPSAWYYSEDKDALKRDLLEMRELEREIGLHNNVVVMAWKEGHSETPECSTLPAGFCKRAAELMHEQLEELRDLSEGPILGCAAHGDALYYSDGVDNMEIWAVGYKPEDFGMEYEAYQLHAKGCRYVTDNHGKMTGPLEADPDDPDREKQLHLLCHPGHWQF